MEPPIESPVFRSIEQLLVELNLQYRVVRHAPTRTSAESAEVRGEPLEIGAKALLLKCDNDFQLWVLPAHRKIDSAAVKRLLGVRKTRFATPEELLAYTGLVPGSVPPFGPPILPFPVWVDRSIEQNPRVAFNAGSLSISVIMPIADYLLAARPQLATFSTSPESDA